MESKVDPLCITNRISSTSKAPYMLPRAEDTAGLVRLKLFFVFYVLQYIVRLIGAVTCRYSHDNHSS